MQEIWTISSLLNWTKQYFARKGVENPRLDAEVLLSFVLDTERIQLYVRFDQPLEEDELVRFREAVRLRAERMPKKRSCRPCVLWASGFMLVRTPFSLASFHQRQSMSSRQGLALSSMIVPVAAAASMIAGMLTA